MAAQKPSKNQTYQSGRGMPAANNALYWSNRAMNHDVLGQGPADTARDIPTSRGQMRPGETPVVPIDRARPGLGAAGISSQQPAGQQTPQTPQMQQNTADANGVVSNLAAAAKAMARPPKIAAPPKAGTKSKAMNKPHPDPQNSAPGANHKGGNNSLPGGKPYVKAYDRVDPRTGRKVHVNEYRNPREGR